jgi:hypothetical protein
MQPEINIFYPAVFAAAIAQFFIGWIWFTFLFGRLWAKEMGITMDGVPDKNVMIRGMVLNFFGNLLVAYVLAHAVSVWRPSVWGAGEDSPFYVYGFFGAFFTWIGYYIPQNLTGVAWGGRSWIVFGIDASGQFVSLLAAAMILAGWR